MPDTPLSPLGTSGLEPRIAAGTAFGDLDAQVLRIPDSWTRLWPSLDSFIAANPPISRAKAAKFCIATDDIVGPTRNGGIGTTYAALARLLAGIGLDVTIVYLKGSDVENATLDHWIAHYARQNIRFVPVPNKAAADRLETNGDNCLAASYNLLHFLLANPMDVVHVSEWRGAGFLSLVLKSQALAFRDTTFVVKASSPWLWDRLYGMQPLCHASDLVQMHAERQSLELADICISGSTHLLRFMSSQGYRLPSQTFVQPNVIDLSPLANLTFTAHADRKKRVPVEEVVFFGRLEGRKGLVEFIAAVARMIRLGGPLPAAVTFLGKPGLPLAERPELSVVDYIREQTSGWPMPVHILTSMQQSEALRYLMSAARLAVMPSQIENSSLVIYETALCGVPFVASNAGGNAELVDARDAAEALVEPHPLPLAARLTAVLRDGALRPRPAFLNDENLETWRAFHHRLPVADQPASGTSNLSTAALIYAEDVTLLEATLADLAEQDEIPAQVFIGIGDNRPAALQDAALLAARYTALSSSIVDVTDCGIGLAIIRMAGGAQSDLLLCIEAGTRLVPHAISTVGRVASWTGADFLNFFYRQLVTSDPSAQAVLRATLSGAAGLSFFANDLSFFPFALRRASFSAGLVPATDFAPGGIVQELVGRAKILGLRCETIPIELASVAEAGLMRGSRSTTAKMVAARPYLAAAPLALRDILMRAQGLHSADTAARRSQSHTSKGLRKLDVTAPANSVRCDAPPSNERPCITTLKITSSIDGVRKYMHSLPVEACPTKSDASGEHVPLTGAFLTVRNCELTGWIRDETNPSENVKLEAHCGTRIVDSATAYAAIETYEPPRNDFANHFFRLRIPRTLHAREISLWVAGGRAPWLQIRTAGLADNLGKLGYRGWCDWTDPERINGWVWRPSHTNERIAVAIFIDGRFYVRVAAELHRRDLQAAGIGGGDYAFSIQVPKPTTPGKARLFEVSVADSGVLLNRGRMVLADGRWRRSWRDFPKKFGLWR